MGHTSITMITTKTTNTLILLGLVSMCAVVYICYSANFQTSYFTNWTNPIRQDCTAEDFAKILSPPSKSQEHPQNSKTATKYDQNMITKQTIPITQYDNASFTRVSASLLYPMELGPLPKDLFFSTDCLPSPSFSPPPPVPQQDCTSPFVLMNHDGRFGNKISQYTSLFLLRHFFGVRAAISPVMHHTISLFFKDVALPVRDQACFQGNITTRRGIGNITRISYEDLYRLLYEAGEAMAKNSTDGSVKGPLLQKSYYVYSAPCPRNLFLHHRRLVQKVLAYKEEVLVKARGNIAKALPNFDPSRRDSTLVTVHVRRTDYIGYMRRKFHIPPLGYRYFQRAFEFYRQRVPRPVFMVVSDDMKWCREVMRDPDVVFAGSSNSVVDHAVLSLGQHTITSYGTFSYSGAILSKGHITHPANNNTGYNHHLRCVRSLAITFISRD